MPRSDETAAPRVGSHRTSRDGRGASRAAAEPGDSVVRPSCMTLFQWPAQDGESDTHELHAVADGTVDHSGAFVRVFVDWTSQIANLVQLRAQIASQPRLQGITVSTLRQWVQDERLGYATISLDGVRILMPVDHLIVPLRQIEWFNSDECPK
jgi:hypothetical protein